MKKTILLIIVCIFLLLACSPQNGQKASPTSPTFFPIPYTVVIPDYTATPKLTLSMIPDMLTKGSYTPPPTEADNVKHVSQCEASIGVVRYVITGQNVSKFSLFQVNDKGEIDQGYYVVPYSACFVGFKYGDLLSVSASVDTGSGPITCQIYDGSILLAENTSDSLARCMATRPLPG